VGVGWVTPGAINNGANPQRQLPKLCQRRHTQEHGILWNWVVGGVEAVRYGGGNVTNGDAGIGPSLKAEGVGGTKRRFVETKQA